MAKPSTLPEWGTDATFGTGPETGSDVVVTPSYNTQGFIPGSAFVGPHVNWLLNLIYQWVLYLQNLHTEATGFLDQNFTWTGTHTFNTAEATFEQEIQAEGGIDTVGTDIVTGAGDVTTTGGHISTAGGGFSTTTGSFSSTSNGSFITGSGDFNATSGGDHKTTGSGNFEVSNATTNQRFLFTGTLPTVTKPVSLSSGGGNSDWTWTGIALTNTLPTTAKVYTIAIDNLPQGATLKGYEAGVTQDAEHASDALTISLVYRPISGAGLGGESTIASDAVDPDGGGGYVPSQTIGVTSSTHTVDNTANRYFLNITASDSSGSSNTVSWARVQFEDPGPRNN